MEKYYRVALRIGEKKAYKRAREEFPDLGKHTFKRDFSFWIKQQELPTNTPPLLWNDHFKRLWFKDGIFSKNSHGLRYKANVEFVGRFVKHLGFDVIHDDPRKFCIEYIYKKGSEDEANFIVWFDNPRISYFIDYTEKTTPRSSVAVVNLDGSESPEMIIEYILEVWIKFFEYRKICPIPYKALFWKKLDRMKMVKIKNAKIEEAKKGRK